MLTAEAARDSVDYVRTAAINSLYNLLYDDYDGRDDADLIGRLVEAVMLAGQCDMVSEIRGVYLRTVGLLVERYGERLGSADMDRVMMPLVDAFQSQRYDYRCSLELRRNRARQLYKNISMLFLFPVTRDLLFTK